MSGTPDERERIPMRSELKARDVTTETPRTRARRVPGRVEDALVELLSSRELADVSVSDVIRVSGVSRGSFYRYYASLAEAVDATLADEARRYARYLSAQTARRVARGMGARETYEITRAFLGYVEQRRSFFLLLLSPRTPEWGFERFCDRAVDEYRRQVGQAHGRLPEGVDADFYYYATTRSFLAYVRYWLERPHGLDVEGFARQVMLVSHPELLLADAPTDDGRDSEDDGRGVKGDG